MIPSSGNKSDAIWDSHSMDYTFVGKLHFYLECFRGKKGDTSFQGFLRNTALPGENGVISHKSSQISFGKFFADIFLIFCEKYSLLYVF